MSAQLSYLAGSGEGLDNQPPSVAIRASLAREIRYLLTISTEARRVGCITPAGLAHSIGVCFIEDSNMARGKGGKTGGEPRTGLPRFVDVKLTAEQRKEFVTWVGQDTDLTTKVQELADEGYRLGVAWSGERQAYTVSVTCREPGDANNGLCMTSFAGSLPTAIWLALYKHEVVTSRKWLTAVGDGGEAFG